MTSPSPGLPLLSYNDPGVFSIELPANWTVAAKTATEIQFSGPTPGSVVIVAWSRHPRPDQLADWRQQAAGLARLDPTYHQIRIQRVNYRGYNAADWEFTEVYQGKPTHFLDRGFIVRPGHLAFAIELYGPEFTWGVVFANTWYELVNSFRPAY